MLHLEDVMVAINSKYTLKSKYDRVLGSSCSRQPLNPKLKWFVWQGM